MASSRVWRNLYSRVSHSSSIPSLQGRMVAGSALHRVYRATSHGSIANPGRICLFRADPIWPALQMSKLTRNFKDSRACLAVKDCSSSERLPKPERAVSTTTHTVRSSRFKFSLGKSSLWTRGTSLHSQMVSTTRLVKSAAWVH